MVSLGLKNKISSMKKLLYLLCAALITNSALAAPGDTTWVQANICQLSGYGNYDTTINFPAPGTSYRNIYMIFTLGKYVCPGSPTYCGDWDYTVLNYLMTPGGDTMELGRLITPYANAGAPRTPWTWQQHYVYDVTDYASKLQGSATMRILFSGYSGGFTADVKFAFVEGTPDRDVKGIETLWSGSYGYGGSPDINSHFPTKNKTAPAGTVSAAFKFLVTGHGADASGCCEFAPHDYHVMLNGSSVADKTIWRDNCGINELSPQSGTWVYNRGNWCPGAMVYPNYHILPGITAGSTYDIGVQFDAYTGGGSYTTEGTLISYGPMNKTADVGIEDIVSPTLDENHFRENPFLGGPVIHVKNRGAATVTSIAFQYGIQDSTMAAYTWSGSLAPLADTIITLPVLANLNTVAGTSGMYTFVAKITSVNGTDDVDPTNNTMKSQFVAAPVWPSPFKIVFATNNEETTPGSGISETEWKIYNMAGAVVASRTGAQISKSYTDTITLYTGAYKLEINDGGCNGLYWWANPSGTTGGSFSVRKLTPVVSTIPMNGYQYSGSFNNDFGCNFTQYFYVNHPDPSRVNNISAFGATMEVYPNPARDVAFVDFSGINTVNGTVQVIDAMGRIVKSVKCTDVHQQLELNGISTGVYTVQFVNEAGSKLQQRLLIAK